MARFDVHYELKFTGGQVDTVSVLKFGRKRVENLDTKKGVLKACPASDRLSIEFKAQGDPTCKVEIGIKLKELRAEGFENDGKKKFVLTGKTTTLKVPVEKEEVDGIIFIDESFLIQPI